MAENAFCCPYCGRKDFKTQRGLSRHQQSSVKCKKKKDAQFGYQTVDTSGAFFMQPQAIVFPNAGTVGAIFNQTGPAAKKFKAKETNVLSKINEAFDHLKSGNAKYRIVLSN